MNTEDMILTGDLVRMKYQMFWHLKSNPRISYTEDIAAVIKSDSHMMTVMWPDGKINRMDKDFFEVLS